MLSSALCCPSWLDVWMMRLFATWGQDSDRHLAKGGGIEWIAEMHTTHKLKCLERGDASACPEKGFEKGRRRSSR